MMGEPTLGTASEITWVRRKVGRGGVAGVLVVPMAVAMAAEPMTDDWPRYGHDGALTGRSSLSGRITNPRTAWTYQTGGREWQVEIMPAQGHHTLRLDASAAPTNASPIIQPPAGPAFDLDGSGTLRAPAENYHERWAKILPEVKGWQRAAWNETGAGQKSRKFLRV